MVIAVDFDGCLCENRWPESGNRLKISKASVLKFCGVETKEEAEKKAVATI